jgi:hypothetical protein
MRSAPLEGGDDASGPVTSTPGVLTLAEAVDLTRTGDIWIFRGRSAADRAIQVATNAPVNHVGMAVVLDDMPPLMWHAELGQSLPDMWTGQHQRGVQLHDLHDAVRTWGMRYGQRAWLRQLDAEITPSMEAALLRVIARMDGTPFPSTASLAARWVRGRVRSHAELETTYCAEVVAGTYQAMGLLPGDKPENYYDPGHFWSRERLPLLQGASLGTEIRVTIPDLPDRPRRIPRLSVPRPPLPDPRWVTAPRARLR